MEAHIRSAERGWTQLLKSKADARLADLYAVHAASAARLAFFLTGDREEAQDIAQEAFVRVGGRLMTLRDPDNAAGYLYRTITNLSRGHGRWLQRNKAALHHPILSQSHEAPQDLGTQHEMWQTLMKLPLRQRTALFLRYYLDLSEADSARALDCSVEAMKSLTHRAIEALRKHMKGASS